MQTEVTLSAIPTNRKESITSLAVSEDTKSTKSTDACDWLITFASSANQIMLKYMIRSLSQTGLFILNYLAWLDCESIANQTI